MYTVCFEIICWLSYSVLIYWLLLKRIPLYYTGALSIHFWSSSKSGLILPLTAYYWGTPYTLRNATCCNAICHSLYYGFRFHHFWFCIKPCSFFFFYFNLSLRKWRHACHDFCFLWPLRDHFYDFFSMVMQVIKMLDDHGVSSDGIAVYEVAYQVRRSISDSSVTITSSRIHRSMTRDSQLRHRVVVPTHQPMQPVRKPYTVVDFISKTVRIYEFGYRRHICKLAFHLLENVCKGYLLVFKWNENFVMLEIACSRSSGASLWRTAVSFSNTSWRSLPGRSSH